jgi:hypothetical protein
MKSLSIKVLLIVFVFSVSLFSCKKDDKTGGTIKYDSKTYEVSHGYIANPTPYGFIVLLGSSDLNYDESISDVTGTGDFLILSFVNMDSKTELTTANYVNSTTELTHVFVGAEFVTGYNSSTGNAVGDYESDDYPAAGTVELTKSGDKYEINYDYYASGKQVTGTYSGKLVATTISLKKNGKIYSFEK